MALYQTQVTLIHPTTQQPTPVTLYVEGPNQGFADVVSDMLNILTAYTGNVAELRAIAVQLIIDIDANA